MNTALKKYTNFESEEFEGVEQSITIVKDQLEVLGQMFHNFNSSVSSMVRLPNSLPA